VRGKKGKRQQGKSKKNRCDGSRSNERKLNEKQRKHGENNKKQTA
jgi:hypothetical protein